MGLWGGVFDFLIRLYHLQNGSPLFRRQRFPCVQQFFKFRSMEHRPLPALVTLETSRPTVLAVGGPLLLIIDCVLLVHLPVRNLCKSSYCHGCAGPSRNKRSMSYAQCQGARHCVPQFLQFLRCGNILRRAQSPWGSTATWAVSGWIRRMGNRRFLA